MSQEVLKSELDLFKSSTFQASIESSQLVQFRPISSIIDSSSIEFDISLLPDEYYDFQNVFLWIKGKVKKSDGSAMGDAETKKFSIINYALNTMWEQIDIYLGNTLISQSSNTHPYRSFIEVLTSYNLLAAGTHLRSAGLDSTDSLDAIDEDLNKIVDKSKEFTLYGRINGDIFNSDRLLLNGVPIRIVLTKGKDAFNFLVDGDISPKLHILDASLFIRKVKVSPTLLSAHAKALQITKAKYPIKRTEVKLINLNSGQSSFVLDNVWMGQMPSKLIFALVEHDAASGNLKSNALGFKNNGLNYLAVHINGDMYPTKAYQPDFENDNYEREYFEFFNNLGYTLSSTTPMIPFKAFKESFCLYVFNFNADFDQPRENEYINLSREGFLNIEVHFKTNLLKNLKAVCYAQFDNIIEIDSNRNVTTDF